MVTCNQGVDYFPATAWSVVCYFHFVNASYDASHNASYDASHDASRDASRGKHLEFIKWPLHLFGQKDPATLLKKKKRVFCFVTLLLFFSPACHVEQVNKSRNINISISINILITHTANFYLAQVDSADNFPVF